MAALIKPGQNVWGAPKAHDDAVQKTQIILPQKNSLSSPHHSFSEDKLTSVDNLCNQKVGLNSTNGKKETQREPFFKERLYLENQKASDSQMVAGLISSHWNLSSYLKLDESRSSMENCITSELNDIKPNCVRLEGTEFGHGKRFLSAQRSSEDAFQMKHVNSSQRDSLASLESSSPMHSYSSDGDHCFEDMGRRRTDSQPSTNNTDSWRSSIGEEQEDPLFEDKLKQESQKAIESHNMAMRMLSSVDGFTPTELRALHLDGAMSESASLSEQDEGDPAEKVVDAVERKPMSHFQHDTVCSEDWRSLAVMENPRDDQNAEKNNKEVKNLDAGELSRPRETRWKRNLELVFGDAPGDRDSVWFPDRDLQIDEQDSHGAANGRGDGALNNHTFFSQQTMFSSSLHTPLPLPAWDSTYFEKRKLISPDSTVRNPIDMTNWNILKEQKHRLFEERICQRITNNHSDRGQKTRIGGMSPHIISDSFQGSAVKQNARKEMKDMEPEGIKVHGKVGYVSAQESKEVAQMVNGDTLQDHLPQKPISFPEVLLSPFHSHDLSEQERISSLSPLSVPMTWASWIAREAQKDPLFEEKLCQEAQKAANAHGMTRLQESRMSLSPYASSDDACSSVDRFTPMELRMLLIDKGSPDTSVQCNGRHEEETSNVIDHKRNGSLSNQDIVFSCQSSQHSASPVPPDDLVCFEQESRISPCSSIRNSDSQKAWVVDFEVSQETQRRDGVTLSAEPLSTSKTISPDASFYDSLAIKDEASTDLQPVKSCVQSLQNENATDNDTIVLPHTDSSPLPELSCIPESTWEQSTSENEITNSPHSTSSKSHDASWNDEQTCRESIAVAGSPEGHDPLASQKFRSLSTRNGSSSPDHVFDRNVNTPTLAEQTDVTDNDGTNLADSLISDLDAEKSCEDTIQNELAQKDICSSNMLSSSHTPLDSVSFPQGSPSSKNNACWTIMFERDPNKPRKRSCMDVPSEVNTSSCHVVKNGYHNTLKVTLSTAGAPPTMMRSRIPVMARLITTEETKAQIDECVAKLKEFKFSFHNFTPNIVVPMQSPEKNIVTPPLPSTTTNKQCAHVVGKSLRPPAAPIPVANPLGNCANKTQHRKVGFFGNKCRLEKRGPKPLVTKSGTLKGKRQPSSKPSDNRGTKGAAVKMVCKDKPRHFMNPSEKMYDFFQYNTANDWTKKIEGFQIVQALAINHPYTLQLRLHGVCLALEQNVSNLRSSVAVKAMDTIAVLYHQMGKEMDCVAERIGRALLLTFSQTHNKFIHERADHALDALVENCSHEKTLSSLLNTGLDHRCATVRASAAKHLHLLSTMIGEKYFLRPSNSLFVEKFFKAVWKMSADAAQDVRHYGREMFQKLSQKEKFQELWKKIIPDKEMGLFNKLHCTI